MAQEVGDSREISTHMQWHSKGIAGHVVFNSSKAQSPTTCTTASRQHAGRPQDNMHGGLKTTCTTASRQHAQRPQEAPAFLGVRLLRGGGNGVGAGRVQSLCSNPPAGDDSFLPNRFCPPLSAH